MSVVALLSYNIFTDVTSDDDNCSSPWGQTRREQTFLTLWLWHLNPLTRRGDIVFLFP